MPIPHRLSDHYEVPPENYWRESYFEVDTNYMSNIIQKTLELLQTDTDTRSRKALDIGSGIGKGIIALKKAGFHATGIEPSAAFREMAITKMNINPEEIVFSSIEDVDFPQNTFDFINFGAVLEHIYDPAKAIERTLPWLKPGGIIHAEVPSSNWEIAKLGRLLLRLRGTDLVLNLSPMHKPFHLHEFSRKSFVYHGKKAGYTLKFSIFYVCKTYLPKIISTPLKWYMGLTNTGMQLAVYLSK